MIVPNICIPLLREQRTSYRDIPHEYADELKRAKRGDVQIVHESTKYQRALCRI